MKISLNTDLTIRGDSFHIQTEDWGIQHQKLVTRIYKQGQMLKTFTLHYCNIEEHNNFQSLKNHANALHQKVIDWLQTEPQQHV